jgi:hypothetical protein
MILRSMNTVEMINEELEKEQAETADRIEQA